MWVASLIDLILVVCGITIFPYMRACHKSIHLL